ncbi:efflux RND transporter periplasmic adaptor subunit, partial [Methylobrevis pamukkalensis]|uniref:efflux RND transporter periplasmic adaptor subunit n=1 Tax=Methylobrevis pamukkalensis TaxID=1439726 RepID=UPI000845D686
VAEIRPRVDGIIEERLFTEGTEVKAGDPLYRIESASYAAALAAAEAAQQKAEASVQSARARSDRYAQLARIQGVSEQDLEEARASYLSAQADVAAAKADVDAARINLDYTTVQAPISGQIGVSSVTAGALVTASQTTALATIRQLDPIYVDLTDSSANLLRVRRMLEGGSLKGDPRKAEVRLTLEDGTAYGEVGSIQSAEATVSEATGTFAIRVKIANPRRLLLPGMYVRAELSLGEIEGAFRLPQRAVGHNARGETTAMFVTAEDKAETRVITASRTSGNDWVVTEGVSAGDRLIVEGAQNLRDGAAVTPEEMVVDPATG